MAKLRSSHYARVLDGERPNRVEFFDVLQARASIKSGTSAGRDKNPPEIWKTLSVAAVHQIWRLFQSRLSWSTDEDSPHWRIIEFVGVPKEKFIQRFTQFRWIGVTATLQKWYMRTLRPSIAEEGRASSVNTYAFKRGKCVEDVVAVYGKSCFKFMCGQD